MLPSSACSPPQNPPEGRLQCRLGSQQWRSGDFTHSGMGEPPYTKIWQRQEMQTENNNYNKQAFFLDLFSIFGPAVEQGWNSSSMAPNYIVSEHPMMNL